MSSYPDRVVLLACSAKKKRFRTPMPASAVYDGPVWRTWRKAVRQADREGKVPPFGIVLSARYGFVYDCFAVVEDYDQRLTLPRARQILAEPALLAGLKVTGTAEVLLAGGKLYRDTMRRALGLVGYKGPILEPPVRGIGDIRAAVNRFVQASPRYR